MVHSPNPNPSPPNPASRQQFVIALMTALSTLLGGAVLLVSVMVASRIYGDLSNTKIQGNQSGVNAGGDITDSFNNTFHFDYSPETQIFHENEYFEDYQSIIENSSINEFNETVEVEELFFRILKTTFNLE